MGPASLTVDARTRFKGLYVSDLGAKFGQGGVFLLTPPSYDVAGRLTKGMYAPVGLCVDRFGNLYVANADGHDVTEYSPGKKSPKCTYTGAVDPTSVKTDDQDEVYVMDWKRRR